MTRPVLLLVLGLLVSTGASGGSFAESGARFARSAAAADRSPSGAPPAAGRGSIVVYRAPVAGGLQVLRRFRPPLTRYGAGHLGVDLAAAANSVVVAAGAGRVAFAGPVAGRGVVVVAHTDGVRTEYEPVRPLVHAGAEVSAGAPLGRVSGRHAGCPRSCLHWGARRLDDYFDPLTLLRALGPVRLLPWTPDAGGNGGG